MTNFGIVLIDDLRSFKEDVDATIIRTAAGSVEWLNTLSYNDTIESLWLDHDLGKDAQGQATDIRDFVKTLEEMAYFNNSPVIDTVFVHTSNSVGSRYIIAALEKYYNVEQVYAGNHLIAL